MIEESGVGDWLIIVIVLFKIDIFFAAEYTTGAIVSLFNNFEAGYLNFEVGYYCITHILRQSISICE